MIHLRRNKTGYKAVFLREVANGFLKVDVKDIDIAKEFVSYKDKTYPINLKDSAYVDKGTSFYFYDIDGNKLLSLREFKFKISPEDIDNLIVKHVIGNLMQRVREGLSGSKGAIMMYIVLIGLGVGIGVILGQTAFPKEVTRTLIQNSTGTYPAI
jgi:hypothetical protein